MLVVDEHGRIERANARAEALLDSEAALQGRSFTSLVDAAEREAIAHALQRTLREGEAPRDQEIHLAGGSSGGALVDTTFLPLHDGRRRVLLLLRDLTEESRRRDDAMRAQSTALDAATSHQRHAAQAYLDAAAENRKMADLGKLIAGVTHEFRTPLTYVTNGLSLQRSRLESLMHDRPDLEPMMRELLSFNESLQSGASRLAHLVQELRPLAKNRPHHPRPTDLAELVMDAVRTFRGARPGVRVELDLQATHAIPMDREDMCNVLLNLLNNAADATGEKGAIRVITRNVSSPPEIRVIDAGPGVPPAALARLFEPFHTTKRDGTGLGLFISQRTVEAHGGTLTHEPTPGGGATFVVRFPQAV